MKNYYEVLQVTKDASDEVIKAAYRSLIKKYHPDAGVEVSGEKVRLVEEAYQTLSDAEKRRTYDMSLSEEKERTESSSYLSTKVETDTEDDDDTYSSGMSSKVSNAIGSFAEFIESVIGLAVLGFIIWCLFIGNGEKLKMDLFNKLGIVDFATKGEKYEVTILTQYTNDLLTNDGDYWLTVDGERIALLTVDADNLSTVQLCEGKHYVYLESKFWHSNSTKIEVNITGNNLLGFVVKKGEIYNGY